MLLYVAGHETTVNLIGNGMLALLRHPDELARWRDDPSLDATAVDELLRYDGPVQQTVRIPMQDVRYGDVEVAPGLGGDDRARRGQPRPGDVRRPGGRCASTGPNANRHLGFASGIHYCLGASLAKLEASVAITLGDPPVPRPSSWPASPHWRDRLTIRGVDRLPLAWWDATPVSPPGGGARACCRPNRRRDAWARRARHGRDGRPPVLVAASTRPPSVATFLSRLPRWRGAASSSCPAAR